jgi:hypothetical protein
MRVPSSLFASFIAAACVAVRACVYGSTPRTAETDRLEFREGSQILGADRDVDRLGGDGVIDVGNPPQEVVRTTGQNDPSVRSRVNGCSALVSVRSIAPSYSSIGAVGSAADSSCVLRPRVAAGGWPDEFGRSVDQELKGRFSPN